MSYNQYRMPPFNNAPPPYFTSRPPPANFYSPPPTEINFNFSLPPPPFTPPTYCPPPANFQPPVFTPNVPPPSPHPPSPYPSPYCDYRPRIPSIPPPQPRFVPFGVRQFTHDQRPQYSGPGSYPPSPSVGPGPRWNGPRHTQSPDVNWRPAHSFGKSQGVENSWSAKRQRFEQTKSANVQPSKKVKIDKRDLPENNAFYCDRCDRGFKTDEKLQEHVGQHVKCRVGGCNYLAAPKLVQLHFELHHRTGLAKKVMLASEDDEKWIMERKRNYPTAENLERKRKEAAERRARGDVLGNRYFGKIRGGGRGRGGNRCGDGRNVDQSSVKEVISESKTNDVDASTDKETNAELVVETIKSEPTEQRKPVVIDENQSKPSNGNSLGPVRHKNSVANCQQKFQRKKKSTLLEKLLAPEIRHERNVILQCIRFVVGHFNLRGEPSNATSEDPRDAVIDTPSLSSSSIISSPSLQEVPTIILPLSECPMMPVDRTSPSAVDSVVECTTDGDSGIGSPARNNNIIIS